MRIIKAGATSQSIYVDILDSTSTSGGRKTGLAYNTSSLVAYYARNGAAAAAITLATQTASGAWSSGGFVEVEATNMPGIYRLDIPDAVVAAGAPSVVVILKGATGMVEVSTEIQLTAVDLQDAVRGGMTALPNANAEANGGLYTRGSGAGQINQSNNGQIDANAARTGGTTNTGRDIGASVLLSAGTGTGQIDFTAGVVKSNLVQILGTVLTETAGQIAGAFKQFFDVASPTGTMKAITNVVTTTNLTTNNDKTGYGLSAAAVQAIWDAATSALTTAGSIGKWILDKLDVVLSTRLATSGYTAPDNTSIAAIKAALILQTGTAAAGGGSTITLQTALGADSLPKNCLIAITSGTGVGQVRAITGYVNSTKVATVGKAWVTNPDNTSVYYILNIDAGAVWDVTTSDHTGSGTTGNSLNSAGSAGDPWATALPGTYGAGTAGKIIGDNINATISSRASQTSNDTIAGYIDTEVAAIKTQTDKMNFGVTNQLDVNVVGWKGATAPNNTGDAYARLGTPAGASVSADVAAIKSDTGAIKAAQVLATGTAGAGAGSTITLQTALGADNLPNGCLIAITGGTGVGQCRVITGYVNSTKVATVGHAWTTNPDNTSVYYILNSDAAKVDSNLKVAGVVLTDTVTTYTGNTPQTGDAYARIGANGAGLTAVGDTPGTTTLLSRIASTLNITSGKVDVNDKTGFSLSSAGIQAIWDALTSALTTAGSIGKRLVDNVDAAISSRSTYGGGDTSGTTTLLGRLTSGRAGNLDNLDTTVSSRNATTPPTVAAIRAEIDANSTKLDAAISSRASQSSLNTNATKIDDIWKVQGLDAANAKVVTPTSIDAGSGVHVAITGDGVTSATFTRS